MNGTALWRGPRAGKADLTPRQRALLVILATLAGLGVRLVFFGHQSRDYEVFLLPWYEELKANGGLAAIGRPIGDYLPSYIYILAGLTHLPIGSLAAIKLVSCLGDAALAAYAMKLVLLRTRRQDLAALAYGLVLLLPTVVLNSAAWAQCDSLYTAALLAFVYFMMARRPAAGMAAYGVAFIFKLQAVFLAPLVLLLLLKGRVKFRQLFIVPGLYLLAILPAALAGRPLWDLLTVYFRQAGGYSALSLGAPNLYAFLQVEDTLPYSVAGVALFVGVTALLLWRLWRLDFCLTNAMLLKFALLFALLVPFLLPHMHERYFYPADVLAVVVALTCRRRWPVAVVVCGSSLLVVGRYLFGWQWMDPAYAAVPMLLAVLFTLADALAAATRPAAARPGGAPAARRAPAAEKTR